MIMKYAILYNPGHNRVYYETSLKLSEAEFAVVSQSLSSKCENVQNMAICGIDYLMFETDKELTDNDIKILFDLSFIYALFEVDNIDGEYHLIPQPKLRESFIDEGISSMLKYTGKTNEIFTRMMINLAVYSSKYRENIKLLDPIAGKGTTLYEGLVKGYDVYGIEIGDTVVNESQNFVKRYLENAKYKFSYSSNKLTDPDKTYSAVRHTFETSPNKDDFKANNTKTIEIISGNSMFANKYYKKNTFDVIVGDLPYGVQHGNVTNQKQSSLTRNPAELLDVCLPVWAEVLKIGGVMVLAWNSNVLPRHKAEAIAEKHGLKVRNTEISFEHRVDQSILRDILIIEKV